MTDTNPRESLDAEGIPDLDDHPPGRGIELDEEATMAPRDHPVASGGDPAYPVTANEERQLDTVAERAARENPDVGAEELGVGGGVVGMEARGPVVEDPGVGAETEDASGFPYGEEPGDGAGADTGSLGAAPEESAMHEAGDLPG